jgi:hypothetical protein
VTSFDATTKADVALKDADPTPKPGINGPSTVVGYPGRATITDKDVEFHTDYDKVMAIWRNLAHTDFTYRVDVPYRDDAQSLADFLVKRQGFCQQFASLMAVMLRAIGRLARVAFGYNQGTALGNGVYSVRTKNFHSWIEVPFQGYGWLGFDPSPGVADPSATYMPKNASEGPPCPRPLLGCTAPPVKAGNHGNGTHNVKGSGFTGLGEESGGVAGDVGPTQTGPAAGRPIGVLLAAGAALALALAIGIPLLHRARRRRRLTPPATHGR